MCASPIRAATCGRRAGKTITVNLPAPTNVCGTYQDSAGQIGNFRPRGEQYPTFTVDASNRQFSFEDLAAAREGEGLDHGDHPHARSSTTTAPGTTGTAIDNAWKQQLYDQIDGVVAPGGSGLGVWQNVPFNVANFWPGVTAAQVNINVYTVIGRTLLWIVDLAGVPQPTPASNLLPMLIPGGQIFNNAIRAPMTRAYDGTEVLAYMLAIGTSTGVAITRVGGGNWIGPALYVNFQAIIPLA